MRTRIVLLFVVGAGIAVGFALMRADPTVPSVGVTIHSAGAAEQAESSGEDQSGSQAAPEARTAMRDGIADPLSAVVTVPVWPGLEYELSLVQQMRDATDLSVFLDAMEPLAASGDIHAAYLIVKAQRECVAFDPETMGTPSVVAMEQSIQTSDAQDRVPASLRRLDRCRSVYNTWDDARWFAVGERARAMGHPAALAQMAIAGVVNNEMAFSLSTLRETAPSFHPDALRQTGLILAMQDLIANDRPSAELKPWNLLACAIEGRTTGRPTTGCQRLGAQPGMVEEANRIAEALLAQDWATIGLADPPEADSNG
jgi:hypothetical protein